MMRFLFLILLGFNFVYSQNCSIPSQDEIKITRISPEQIYFEYNGPKELNNLFTIYIGDDKSQGPFSNDYFYHQGLIREVRLPFTFNIDANQSYRIWIRRQCGINEYSAWGIPYRIALYGYNEKCLNSPIKIEIEWKTKSTIEINSPDKENFYHIWEGRAYKEENPKDINPLYEYTSTKLPYEMHFYDGYDHNIYIRRECYSGNTNWSAPYFIKGNKENRIVNENYKCFDNSKDIVNEILYNRCDKNIPVVFSSKHVNQILDELIFEFDEAGNQLRVISEKENANSLVMLMGDYDELNDWSLHFQLAPNPTKAETSLNWDREVNDLIADVSLYPINGAFKIPLKINANTHSLKIDLTHFAPGQYIVSIVLKDGQKIIKHIQRSI